MFSCELCEFSKKTFFQRTPLVPASGIYTRALKRSSDMLFLKPVVIKRRAELALSTVAVVADVVGRIVKILVMFGNIWWI